MPLIIWLWVCNPTLIIVIARQSACRVNIRGNSGHTSASAPHHRPVAQRIAGPVRAWHLYPRWGPENVAHLSHLNPARTKPDRRSVFNPVGIIDTPGPHQVEGNLLGCSVRSSSMHPRGLCCAVSRLASSGGQSLQLIIAGAQIVAQRATRRTKGKSRDHSQLSVCPVASSSPVPIRARSVSRMYACTLMPTSAAAWRMRAPSSLLGRIVIASCLRLYAIAALLDKQIAYHVEQSRRYSTLAAELPAQAAAYNATSAYLQPIKRSIDTAMLYAGI